ncbi:MAG: bacteriohemerythrin [Lachnospiraceae bacterium]|nr:bacteriohemerythrin [Lachnospiraceae bacterium]
MFTLTSDCIIGVEEIDNEHRHLFELLNEGLDMLHNNYLPDRYEDIKALLRELESYADQHFAHEEAYMERLRDPELILQRSQHMVFKEKIRNWYFTNIDEMEEQEKVLDELLNFLVKWLYHHIIGSDIMIGKLPPLEEWMIRENPCEFTDDYKTGIYLIDKEHKELFRIIDKVNRMVHEQITEEDYEEIMNVLGELKAYTEFHFKDEEEYMESIHYEGLAAQKRAHAAFIEKIADIKIEDIEKNPQEYMETLIEYLLGWLINHILYTDKKIPDVQV